MFGAAQRESHILVDGHLWIERIALKNHRYIPISRLQAVDISSPDPDPTPVRGNNPGNQVERRGFPGACRTKNGDELLICDVQGNIFNRFYRVSDPEEKTYPGLGIGLYISHEIIKRHGGDLTVVSEKGKGSLFRFTLPYTRSTRLTL